MEGNYPDGRRNEECIFNLIPKEVVVPPKPPLHRSMYPGKVDSKKRGMATMGPVESQRAAPNDFMKAGAKKINLPKPKPFQHTMRRTKRPPVPKDQPVMGLTTKKNYVSANAVEAILSRPKKSTNADVQYRNKADYGKVPEYLEKIKQQIAEEYRIIEGIKEEEREANDEDAELIDVSERENMLAGLKENWKRVNKAYQMLPFVLDTPAKIRRKEELEVQLDQLEKDIARLSRKYLFVSDEHASTFVSSSNNSGLS